MQEETLEADGIGALRSHRAGAGVQRGRKERKRIMATELTMYLSFDGNCEEAFKFYEKVLSGKLQMMMRFGDAPPEVPRTPETANRIMHARLKVGAYQLMGGDSPQPHSSKPQGFCANIMVDTPNEAERIFRELSDGGKVKMPIGETFWAPRFGMLTDKYGIPWMVNCEKPM
jgi:PhnB protein